MTFLSVLKKIPGQTGGPDLPNLFLALLRLPARRPSKPEPMPEAGSPPAKVPAGFIKKKPFPRQGKGF